ncbi:hypothetical protein GCM10009854_32730 [Saccharopolyspora halophila]|uniref:ASCH domain-containing protein n=1 Tax=Saccharopolyspora halophila TaxID=405551 RepID=A0ABN3GI28_9PSEU
MFSDRIAQAVARGEVTETYRRSPLPPAEAGDRVRTVAGLIGVTEVIEVDVDVLVDDDARRAGFRSAAGLRSSLAKRGAGPVYRVRLAHLGAADPAPVPVPVELSAGRRRVLQAALARLDVESPRGAWTVRLLRRLAESPGSRAADLAAEQQRPVSRCKTDLWRLRELGLVEPTVTGMRLSGLGVAYLDGLAE